tara:strand:+ start:17689 stop:18426 length:738 start_codon:yes stop_codon:yes gene_type:complete
MQAFSTEKAVSFKHEINDIFVIPQGYDTNDNIEITFTSKLPNACFVPDEHIMKKIEDYSYQIEFRIKRRDLSECNDRQLNQFKNPIYYNETISLGELNSGKYTVEAIYEDKIITKNFEVAKARTNSLDDTIYAPISTAFIPEMLYTHQRPRLILTGIIQETCLQVQRTKIEVKRFNNMFLVLPKAFIHSSIPCRPTEKPLQKIISLGDIEEPGVYFIHVRSQSGLSVNKVFRVRNKNFDHSGIEL